MWRDLSFQRCIVLSGCLKFVSRQAFVVQDKYLMRDFWAIPVCCTLKEKFTSNFSGAEINVSILDPDLYRILNVIV